MLKNALFSFFSFLFVFCGVSLSAWAETPQLLGQFGKWQAYSYLEGASGKVCFISAVPDQSEGQYKRRDPVYLMVTHRPLEKASNVVSFIAGYTYKSAAEVHIAIDGQEFSLIGQDNTAWAPDDGTDSQLVDALKRGTKLTVKGYSSKGTLTTDRFSLTGSGQALKAIDQACSGT